MIWKTAREFRELEANAASGCIPVAPVYKIPEPAAFHGVVHFSGLGSVPCRFERMDVVPPTAKLRGPAWKTAATHRH